MALYKCNGRRRFYPDGVPYCDYESAEPWYCEPCPGCGLRVFSISKIGTERSSRVITTLASLMSAPKKPRMQTGIPAFDKVLNGGIGKGQSIIISGPPGVGKTTLLLQLAESMAQRHTIMYLAGEQNKDDLSEYAQRLGVKSDNVIVDASEQSVDILEAMSKMEDNKIEVVILDSLQTSYCSESKGAEGSAEQVRATTSTFTAWAKRMKVAMFLVSHVNKDGDLAGPKAAEHLVDGTLEFDPCPDMDSDGEVIEVTKGWRKLTSGSKFRLGPSGVTETFNMTEGGIFPVQKRSRLYPVK